MMLDGERLDPAAGRPADALVVLLHGYASKGQDLIQLASMWRDVAPGAVFLAPNAPHPCAEIPGAFQWWPPARGQGVDRSERLRATRPMLDAYLDAALARHGVPESRLVLAGFSQGTTAALHVALGRPRAIAGVIGFSGTLSNPESLEPHLTSRPPVLLIHGDADDIVPVERLHEARAALEARDFDVTAHVSPSLGHSIDLGGIRQAMRFLKRVLGAPETA